MNKVKKVAKSAINIMIFVLLSKLLGFFRDIIMASKFGSGYETDAYFVASTACDFIIGIIGYAISITMIPFFSSMREDTNGRHAKEKLLLTMSAIDFRFFNIAGNRNKISFTSQYALDSRANRNNYMNNILNITILFALTITIITWICSPLIIKILAKGFIGQQFLLAVTLSRIGSPMIILMACTSVFTGFLHGNEKFNATAAIGIPYNMVFIVFLIFFSNRFGIKGLMVASIIAVLTQLLLLITSAYKLKFSYKVKIDFKDKNLRDTCYLIFPIVLGSMVDKINTIIDKTLASELVQGSISALNYANRINSLILSAFVMTITTVIYPMLSKEFADKNVKYAKAILKKSMNVILIIVIPTTIGIIVLAFPIIRLLFERGAFDSNATKMTSLALIAYSFGLVGVSLRNIFNKAFYSLKDTKAPMKNGVLAIAINIILNLILIKPMAHIGLALATSIAEICGAILLFLSLRKRIGSIGIKYYTIYITKLGICAGVMGIVVYFINTSLNYLSQGFFLRLISLIICIFFGAIIYLALCYIFGIEDVKIFLRYVCNLRLIKQKNIK